MGITALTGWAGVAHMNDRGYYLRFSSEGVNVPLGVQVSEDMHVGQRTPGVYQYELIKPEGDISTVITTSNAMKIKPWNAQILDMLTLGIQPYSAAQMALPIQMPEIGQIDIYRGDVHKTITGACINSVSISANANSRAEVTFNVKGTWGTKETMTLAEMPDPGFTPVRAVHFNELSWGTLPDILSYTGLSAVGISAVPRQCRLTVNNNLVDDDSYNADNPRALRGFALGNQKVEGSVTCVGYGKVANEPNVVPWTGDYDFGGIYLIKGGMWTVTTINVPGANDISVTDMTFSSITSSKWGIEPGAFLL